MKRRKFLKNTASTAFIGLIAPSIPMHAKEDAKKSVIIRYVQFWLNENISEKEKADFVNFFEDLKVISTIKSLKYGTPAESSIEIMKEDVFSYSLIMHFNNMDDLMIYENHPIHVSLVEKYKKFWRKAVNYDSIF